MRSQRVSPFGQGSLAIVAFYTNDLDRHAGNLVRARLCLLIWINFLRAFGQLQELANWHP
jgi:hypothetical protein